MKRKILSFMLCLCLVLGMLPFAALAGVPSDHDCYYPDGQIWCILCDKVMEHECISNDGNIRCDLCDTLIPHDCRDQDRNGSCDLCTRPFAAAQGDISGDGQVNMGDISMLYAHIRGTAVLTSDGILARCDITGDRQINMGDISKLYAQIRGTNTLS